jgi:16S rRNA processing protein RimM
MPEPERLVVGRVLRPHGVRGELSVEVRAARLHLGRLLLSLEGVTDRDAADRLRGAWLSIPVAAARPLDPGEFWPHQLVGLAVVDRQGRQRGRVADVVPGAAHDLLAVEVTPEGSGEPQGGAPVDQGRRIALVPAVAALVTVELEAGRVLVDALPGLLGDAEE